VRKRYVLISLVREGSPEGHRGGHSLKAVTRPGRSPQGDLESSGSNDPCLLKPREFAGTYQDFLRQLSLSFNQTNARAIVNRIGSQGLLKKVRTRAIPL
jgi:hypothetical protein